MNLTEWIGRSEVVNDIVTPTPYAAMAAMLDIPQIRPAAGTLLPPLWHWLFFLPLHRQSEIGPDGHGKRGGFLPPVPLPRRMWAGSQFEFAHRLRVGDTVSRKSTIVDVTEKSGRSGPLVFVKVKREIRRNDADDIALTEFHDIVYREAARVDDAVPPPKPAPATAAWEKKWIPDDVLLFRYSALTFNGHRIHYDRRYVTETEGYPGLVVHGPLIATLLLESLRAQCPNADIAQYEFRAVRPLFDIDPFTICGEPLPDGKSFHLWARDHEGYLAMDAKATIHPAIA